MKPRLRLLGTPRLEVDGVLSELPLVRPASLGYYLVQRADWVRRSELAYLYNPGADEATALNNLRNLVHRLKGQDWAKDLEADPTRLRLHLPSDLQDFRVALERQDWAGALEQYGGTFLQGLSFPDLPGYESWLELERQDLWRAWRGALLEQVRGLEGQGEWAQAERWLGRLLRSDPLDEDAVQALMRVLYGAGKTTQARAAFEEFRQVLRRELEAEPLESTRALADSLRSPQVSGAVQTARPKHNLPKSSTRFIGRKGELQALTRQLANPECRLLTLVGLGGMGKTRLGLELAGLQVERFADGVWLVALAGVAGADLLVSSIAVVLGLSLEGASEPKTQLIEHLRDKELLLLLDNFEHLVEGSLLLEELLAQAPKLKLLVTSRVALELSSEWLYDLGGLSYPSPSAQNLEDFESVCLFIARAERVSGDFVLTPAALEATGAIARRVEGMPLALELLATWVRGINVVEVAQRLEQSTEVLSTQLRDIPERQRSLTTVFEHSWKQLSAHEQAILDKLSIFAGGFSAEAAAEVAEASLPHLLKLINHALVRRSQAGRFDLHELTRQHAEARALSDPQSWRLTEQSFTRLYGQLLERAWLHRGPSHQRSLLALRSEIDNLRKAWRLMIEHHEHSHLRGSFGAMFDYFLYFMPPSDGQHFFEQSLHDYLAAGQGSDQQNQHQYTYGLGKLRQSAAAFDYLTAQPGAQQGMEAALVCFRAIGEVSEEAYTLDYLGQMEMFDGRYPQARHLLQQALSLSRSVGDDLTSAWGLNTLGGVCIFERKFEEAIQHLEPALHLFEQLGLAIEVNIVKSNLAEAQGYLGRFELARANLLEVIAFNQSIQSHKFVVTATLALSRIYFIEGNFAQTIQTCQALEHLQGSYLLVGDPYVHIGPGVSYRELGKFQESVRVLLEGFQNSKVANEQIETLIELAHSLTFLGERDLALQLLQHSCDQAPTPPLVMQATDLLAYFAHYQPDPAQAELEPTLRAAIVALMQSN